MPETDPEVLEMHTHPKALIAPVLVFLGCCAAWVATLMYVPADALGGRSHEASGAILVLFALLSPLRRVIRWQFSVYTLTSEQVMARHGMIWRSEKSVPLSRIADVDLHRGLLDRMTGCGTITINPAGTAKPLTLKDIPRVMKVRDRINRAVAGRPLDSVVDTPDRERSKR